MRIEVTFSSLAASTGATSAPAQGELALSFEQLLNQGATLDAVRQERAFGFSELSVVRLDPAEPLPQGSPPGNSSNVAPDNPGPSIQADVAEYPQAATRGTDAPRLEGCPTASVEQSFTEPPTETTAARPHTTPGAQPAMVTPPPPALRPPHETQPCARKAPVRQPPQPVQPRRFSLVVSEREGVIQIIAGAPQLSAEARERLRKAAAMLAAEFGVVLGDFMISGSLIDAPSPTSGASHGDLAS